MTDPREASRRRQWFGLDPTYLPALEDKLFIEGPLFQRRLVTFFTLLLLATVIANYGLLSASTASVIGAMIVAPLMGPIMATAAAVVMGSGRRAAAALALVGSGVVAVIALAWLLTLVVPASMISFTDNPELASRISPGLLALLTALGAGAAGGFITSRAEIADSMGGVAIAISLVPPLCVVGIALAVGDLSAAAGALLLFTTNFLAILLAGGLVFLLAGLGGLARADMDSTMRKRAFALILLSTIIVAIPLSFNAYRAVVRARESAGAMRAAAEWLAGTSNSALAAQVDEQSVVLLVEQADELPPLAELDAALTRTLKHPVHVKLRLIPILAESMVETP